MPTPTPAIDFETADFLQGYRYACFAHPHPYSVNAYERGLRAVNVARAFGVDLSGAAQSPAATQPTIPVILMNSDDGAEHATTWGDFVAANAGDIEPEEFAAIEGALAAGRTYRGGGGAQPEWSIRVAS